MISDSGCLCFTTKMCVRMLEESHAGLNFLLWCVIAEPWRHPSATSCVPQTPVLAVPQSRGQEGAQGAPLTELLFSFSSWQRPGWPAAPLCDAPACTVPATSHPPQSSAAHPPALLGAQVSPFFFCFTILRGFANVVFFFDIFVSYYLRHD